MCVCVVGGGEACLISIFIEFSRWVNVKVLHFFQATLNNFSYKQDVVLQIPTNFLPVRSESEDLPH